MKFLNVFFLAAGLLFISSCGDDLTPEELIVGSWELSSIATTECTEEFDNETIIFGDASCEEENGETFCLIATLVFTAPSTVVFSQFQLLNGEEIDSLIQTATYSFAENGEMTICFDGECDAGTLTVTESSMVWVGNILSDGCITTVTGSK